MTRRVFSGANLRARRKAAGHSLRTLGQELETRTSNISRWENGHRSPQLPMLADIAEALGCQVGDLFEAVAE